MLEAGSANGRTVDSLFGLSWVELPGTARPAQGRTADITGAAPTWFDVPASDPTPDVAGCLGRFQLADQVVDRGGVHRHHTLGLPDDHPGRGVHDQAGRRSRARSRVWSGWKRSSPNAENMCRIMGSAMVEDARLPPGVTLRLREAGCRHAVPTSQLPAFRGRERAEGDLEAGGGAPIPWVRRETAAETDVPG